MRYLLDTNVFIEAYRRYYQEKIVSSFWEYLKEEEDIFTLQEVKDEIRKGKDKDTLENLVKAVKIFSYDKPLTNQQMLSDYIYKNYSSEQAGKFLNVADYLLVCVAKEYNIVIVTHENFLGKGAKKASIPNICKEFDIDCVDTFEMLKRKDIDLSKYNKD